MRQDQREGRGGEQGDGVKRVTKGNSATASSHSILSASDELGDELHACMGPPIHDILTE